MTRNVDQSSAYPIQVLTERGVNVGGDARKPIFAVTPAAGPVTGATQLKIE
jgi:hypothetical protein